MVLSSILENGFMSTITRNLSTLARWVIVANTSTCGFFCNPAQPEIGQMLVRGIFHNKDKTFLVWVNEEDHMRCIAMQDGGSLLLSTTLKSPYPSLDMVMLTMNPWVTSLPAHITAVLVYVPLSC